MLSAFDIFWLGIGSPGPHAVGLMRISRRFAQAMPVNADGQRRPQAVCRGLQAACKKTPLASLAIHAASC